MKLKSISTKPQLTKVVLDDKETIEEYGEALEFWVYDKHPIQRYVKFMGVEDEKNIDPAELIQFCSELILDDDGTPVMNEEEILPVKVLIRCVNKVVEQLGK